MRERLFALSDGGKTQSDPCHKTLEELPFFPSTNNISECVLSRAPSPDRLADMTAEVVGPATCGGLLTLSVLVYGTVQAVRRSRNRIR